MTVTESVPRNPEFEAATSLIAADLQSIRTAAGCDGQTFGGLAYLPDFRCQFPSANAPRFMVFNNSTLIVGLVPAEHAAPNEVITPNQVVWLATNKDNRQRAQRASYPTSFFTINLLAELQPFPETTYQYHFSRFWLLPKPTPDQVEFARQVVTITENQYFYPTQSGPGGTAQIISRYLRRGYPAAFPNSPSRSF